MKAVVLLSGGLDSATTLAIAKVRDGCECLALSFDYGQRHRVELDKAWHLAQDMDVVSCVLRLPHLRSSSLTNTNMAIPKDEAEGIPSTYVPARNTIFLSYGLAIAEQEGAERIYIGVNAVDYSGYPDCRPEYLRAFQSLADLATKKAVEGNPVEVCAPLIAMAKAEIIRRGAELGVDFFHTSSCYDPTPGGLACGECDSCRIRCGGFEEVGMTDPMKYVTLRGGGN